MHNSFTNETLKNIKQRRSIRSYKDEQIKDEELQVVLESGLLIECYTCSIIIKF